jgi:hypothetical protein
MYISLGTPKSQDEDMKLLEIVYLINCGNVVLLIAIFDPAELFSLVV